MNNLWSYCWLVDAKIGASDKDLPVLSRWKYCHLFRTELSGIRPENLENADDFEKVQGEVAEIIRDKIVVGQSIGYDMNYLFLHHRAELLMPSPSAFSKFGLGILKFFKHAQFFMYLCSKSFWYTQKLDSSS